MGNGVVEMERNTNICAGMETRLADLLLDPETAPESVKTHVAGCDGADGGDAIGVPASVGGRCVPDWN